jgi:hypothetical protein
MARKKHNPSVGATVAIALASAAAAVTLTGIVISARASRAINACMQVGGVLSSLQGVRR